MPSAAHLDRGDKDDLLGRTVGKYTLARLLGVGGMGRVYEGVHSTLGKKFALKFIDKESATPEAMQRFHREAQAASAVDSAHIVDIFDFGTSDEGQPYIVMELLRGEDLGHHIRRLGRLDLGEALRTTAHVLRGLARAHDAGIVHRDLKPDNIFLVERDDDPCFAKILDFGVSKIQRPDIVSKTITREGAVLGTPVYMSPEQAQALPDVDSRTDIWAVGAILYECLTGSPPYSGATYEAVIVAICTRDADDVRLHNPEVPEGIVNVLKRALCRDKQSRFASARDMLDALVAESDGLLPTSLKSDSLKRAIIRPVSNPGNKGSMSLAAVSTVAATPVARGSGSGSGVTTVGRASRTYLVAGAIAIGLGGVFAGVWYANRDGSTDTVSPSQPQVIVVQRPGTMTTVFVTAEAPSVTAVAAPPPTVSASADVSSAVSASAPPTTRPVRAGGHGKLPPKSKPPPESTSPPKKNGVATDLKMHAP